MASAHTIHTIRFVIGIIGNITSFFLFFSPAPTFWRIHKNKSVEDFHPYPYLAAVLNCAFWVFYGLPFNHPDSWLVVSINSIGLALELFFLFIYFTYTDKKMRLKVLGILGAEAVFFTIMAVIDILAFKTHERRSMFVGILSVIFGIILYGSPLSIMRQVIQTKNAEFMPFWVCFAGFANGLVWAVYALLVKLDPYILTGNGVGAILGCSQLILWFMYRPTGDDKTKGPAGKSSEVQLPTRAAV